MADTSLSVTAGSGNNIDMRSESTNGDLRQVIVLGDPTTNAGVAPVDATYGLSAIPTPPQSCGDGRTTVTTAGTRVQISVSSIPCKYVWIIGMEANTDVVTVGGSTVVGAKTTRRGIPLAPLQSIRIDIKDVNLLYIDSVVSGEGISYAYFN